MASDSDSHEEYYDDVENHPAVTHVVREEEMLQKGLLVVRYDENMLNRCKNKRNKRRFKTSFGVSPATMCKVYIDLQRSDAEDATMNPPISMRLVGSETNFKWFLRTIYYLRKYPIEEDFERTLAVNIGWVRKNIWRLMQKIQYLKYKRIT
jgi:hypothetical protein